MPLEIFGLRDVHLFRAENAGIRGRVGDGEVNDLLAFLGFAQCGNDDVGSVGKQERNAVGAGDGNEFAFHAERLCHDAGHLDVVPLELLIGAHEAEGRVVLGDGHAQGAAGFDILQLIGAGCGMHAENQGSGYKESREHSGKFHGFPPDCPLSERGVVTEGIARSVPEIYFPCYFRAL